MQKKLLDKKEQSEDSIALDVKEKLPKKKSLIANSIFNRLKKSEIKSNKDIKEILINIPQK